jgi:hypothetical protein
LAVMLLQLVEVGQLPGELLVLDIRWPTHPAIVTKGAGVPQDPQVTVC